MSQKQTIVIKGVPSDLGANMRGANMGPAAARIAGLKHMIESIGYPVLDSGDLAIPIRDELSKEIIASKFLEPVTTLCQDLARFTFTTMSQNQIPIVIGGDHSLAIGSISGISKYYREQNQTFGLIWVDAHADINTHDSSESGNIHGMPLASLLGHGRKELVNVAYPGAKIAPENVVLIGVRTIDGREKEILRNSGITYFDMRAIDERGMFNIMTEVIENLTKTTDGIHLSFDIDGIDPLYAPGVSTPVSGGLSFREAHLLLEMLAESQKLKSMEFVELNPYTDVGPKSAQLTVDLILSALGKTIV